MLLSATPFGQAGSYGLLVDRDLPASQQVAELVRILERRAESVLVSFPLRDGASGTKRSPLADLIDATPLSRDETRALTDLDRELRGKVARSAAAKAKAAKLDALKQRAVWFPLFARKLDAAHALQRRQAQRVAA